MSASPDGPSLYLAGPDVFHAEPIALGRAKRELCARYGFVGLYPLDNEVGDLTDHAAARDAIYRANMAMIRRADALVANVTPFKGVDADAGTAFEVGVAAALGKTVHLYSAADDTLIERMRAIEATGDGAGRYQRAETYAVDDFGGGANLMLLEACRESGGVFVTSASGAAEDLELFERLLHAIAAAR